MGTVHSQVWRNFVIPGWDNSAAVREWAGRHTTSGRRASQLEETMLVLTRKPRQTILIQPALWLPRDLTAGELFAAMDRMAATDESAMTPEEISEELHAMRAERRQPH